MKAALDALLKVMPDSKAKAMTAYNLFETAQIPTSIGRGSRSTTDYKALRQLLYTGEIRRFGKGGPLEPYRYFKSAEESTEKVPTDSFTTTPTRKPKLSRIKQNSALLKTMRGEEANED